MLQVDVNVQRVSSFLIHVSRQIEEANNLYVDWLYCKYLFARFVS